MTNLCDDKNFINWQKTSGHAIKLDFILTAIETVDPISLSSKLLNCIKNYNPF